MPISATVPLENLLEPSVGDFLKKSLFNEEQKDPNQRSGRPRHLYISPPLYATPKQSPVPEDSIPDPFCPSPYVLNHKGHRGGNRTRGVGADGARGMTNGDENGGSSSEVVAGEKFVNERLDVNVDVNGDHRDDDDDDDEGFLDSRCESISFQSKVGENDFLFGRQVDGHSFVSGQEKFFDANYDFSSDGTVSDLPSHGCRIESELHEEIERRKSAEEGLILMRSQFERMSNLICHAGLTFPSFPSATHDNIQLEMINNSIDQFCQEVIVARFVDEAVGRAQGQAEAEEAAAIIIEVKNQEILRLQNRLQYFETVNHEMSQRKLVEVARRQQERKRSRRRWMWSVMGLSISLGASFVAYSYIPHAREYLSTPKSGD